MCSRPPCPTAGPRRQGRRRRVPRRAAGARRCTRACSASTCPTPPNSGAAGPRTRRAGRRGPFDRVRIVSAPTFETLDDVEYGRVDQVADGIRRVIAENPSKFTYRGTGTYIVGHGDVVVVDPGPVLDSHRDALAAALAGERVRASSSPTATPTTRRSPRGCAPRRARRRSPSVRMVPSRRTMTRTRSTTG